MKRSNSIKEYINGEQLDIKKIVNDYSGYLYSVVKNIVNINLVQEDIEEIIADVFFVLWSNKQKLKVDMPLNAYLVGIAKNLIREKYRKNKFTVSIEEDIKFINNIDVESICEQNEKIYLIEKTLKTLKEIDIQIFKMYYYASKKVKEIAKELNVSEVKVKTRLHRIRNKLKNELEKGGYENGK